ncbi:GNAT family N-acetyltransferase [Acidipropionibacterium virtanenii]|uniref:N-acetyltransferase domain-containing protein n=1 Tax=Acidipropionibacterium virtanenii TaxID=2057246 RepID=A0A344UX22_9ACTN|nr:N-acetyltransferase [Acidipropionibacterium virtanenii]AXE39820.1 hypothetical protein JS278_02684 [Acidipropionibacterium virtanenii]
MVDLHHDLRVRWDRSATAVNGDRTGEFVLTVAESEAAGIALEQVEPGVVKLPAAYVHPRFGSGMRSVLLKATLDLLRDDGYQVIPVSPYVTSWIQDHPGYADLVK